jgi:hypothetical protein
MKLPSKYILDKENIKLNAYRLICHFYANKEIARCSDPESRDNRITKLEDKFFFTEISKLLIEIAISLRALDDQMNSLPPESEIKKAYNIAMGNINSHYSCMMFENMKFREVCNKIIHTEYVEPHFNEQKNGEHEIDHYNWLGWSYEVEDSGNQTIPKPDPIIWKHLSNNVRLGGKQHRKQWWYLLEIPIFVKAISELLE